MKKSIFIGMLLISIFTLIVMNNREENYKEDEPITNIVDDKVVKNNDEEIQYPYKVSASILRHYYVPSNKDIKEEDCLVYFEGVYRPNLGVDFGHNNESFEVLASLSGTVSKKSEDPILGLMVTVTTNDNFSITYSSLSSSDLKEGDYINQGSVIGVSGHNLYESDLGNHVHIVMENNGKIINPEECFGNKISKFK